MPTEGETSTTNLEQPSDASPKHGATDDNVPDHNEDNIVYPGFNAQQSATLELMDRQCSKMISKIYLAQANYENQLQKFHDVVGKDIQDQVSQLYQENPFKLETSEDDSRLLRCFAENVLRKAQYQGSRLQDFLRSRFDDQELEVFNLIYNKDVHRDVYSAFLGSCRRGLF